MYDVLSPPRDQMSDLCGVIGLSMMLFDRVEEDEILKIVVDAVPALGPCRAEGVYLDGGGPGPHRIGSGSDARPGLSGQLTALAGGEGRLELSATEWTWGYPLRGVGGHCGYLVVSAAGEPSAEEQFLIRTLASLAGAALNTAALHSRERAVSADLRHRTVELASVNKDLTLAVSELGRRERTHARLISVVATGGAEPEIAAALHELTRLPVVIEDRFGNLLGSSGHGTPVGRRSRTRERVELLNQVRRHGRPVRTRDRVLALAQSRGEVLGTLTLIDPESRAGKFELFALESASMVLATELARQHGLAEMELRLRRDLIDDLLTGTDDDSAHARSAALGHDLHPPHQVLVISWPGADTEERFSRVVARAASRVTQTPTLLTRRDGRTVLVAPVRDGEGVVHDWSVLHGYIGAALPGPAGAIGVGRPKTHPNRLSQSYAEALKALNVRRASADRGGVTTFDELGFYRMLGGRESNREVGEFIREWLGALIDYDATHHCDLVLTLWQYYESGGNYDCTARALVIHRSTLRYRLRRIRELTGHDLGAVDTRLNLHIATRAWQILGVPA